MEVLGVVLVFILFSYAIGQLANKASERPEVKEAGLNLLKRLLK